MQRMNVMGGEVSGDQESVMIMGGVHRRPFDHSLYRHFWPLRLHLLFHLVRAIRVAINSKIPEYALFSAGLIHGHPGRWETFGFIIVFGAFDVSLPNCIVTLGLLNMLNNSLEQWKTANPEAHIPPSKQQPRTPPPAPRVGRR